MRATNTEAALYEQFMQWVGYTHRELLPYIHWDTSGIWTPSHSARNLYGRLNAASRGWPDFTLLYPMLMPGTTNLYSGMVLEFKVDGARLRKRDGTWATPHIAEQAERLETLGHQGFVAQFVVGLDMAVAVLESYLDCYKHTGELAETGSVF
jgi:hypothetical protein